MKKYFFTILFLVFVCIISSNSYAAQTSKPVYAKKSQNEYQISLPLKISEQLVDVQNSSSQIFYFSITPGQQALIVDQQYETSVLSEKQIKYGDQLSISSDSSIIVEKPKMAKSVSTTIQKKNNAQITGYEWFRGFYLARIEVQNLEYDIAQAKYKIAHNVELVVRLNGQQANASVQSRKKNDPHYELLLKQMIVNYDEAVPYQQKSAVKWFVSGQKYSKVIIPRDNIYRIAYDQLKNIFPEIISADPRKFQVINKGLEIPIYISGEDDGTFDSTDYIEFPALRNYTYKHRIITTGLNEFNDYLDRYSDSTYLFFTVGLQDGLRMQVLANSVAASETLNNYTDFRHLETNSFIQFASNDITLQQNPEYTSQDFWGWNFLGANGELKPTFSITDLATTSDSGTAYVKALSWGGSISTNTHILGLRLNGGIDLKKDTLNRYEQTILSSKYPISKLVNGTNNVSVFSYPTASTSVNWVIPDWLEIEFPRQLKAIGDSLQFQFKSLTNRTARFVKITNFSTKNIAIYKVFPQFQKINNITYSASAPFTATFSDTVGPDDQYMVLPTSKINDPILLSAKAFANYYDNTQQTDYIVVTHSKFLPEVQLYKNFLTTSRNLTVKVVEISEVYDEFGFGYPNPQALRDFLQNTMSWPAPIPAYLFLVGDASVDYKFYLKKFSALNYVPSYGYPVSDPLLVTWKSLSNFPQMYIGRLPANNVGDVTQYLTRMQEYATNPFNDWNKRYLFFTGGDPNKQSEIDNFKNVFNSVIGNYVQPFPIGGISTHFYKTSNPKSDFGPYTSLQVKDVISNGAVFISYIGHSGTQTWDNSIGDPSQLKNSRNRSSFLSDFGCSTGKFAEPDYLSFSEVFVLGPVSNAIGYIGNSALGFTSTATTLPIELYKNLLKDSLYSISKAHMNAKITLAQQNFTTTNVVMLYTSEFVGDPSLELAIPKKPNLSTDQSSFIVDQNLSDDLDTAAIKYVISNYGKVINDSVTITIKHTYNNVVTNIVTSTIPVPRFQDTIQFSIGIHGKAGQHSLTASLDVNDRIAELSENDNNTTFSFPVLSSSFQILFPPKFNVQKVDKLVLLKPVTTVAGGNENVQIEIDSLKNYSTAQVFNTPSGNVTTELLIPALTPGRRYYWRAKLQSSFSWTEGTFYSSPDSTVLFGQFDSAAFSSNSFSKTIFDNSSKGIKISPTLISLKAISSGALDGNFGVVEINGINVLFNSFSVGHSLVVMDTIQYEVQSVRTFDLFNQPSNADSLIAFLNAIPSGQIVVSVVIDEGANNFTTAARNAYSQIGASKASLLKFRDSWAVVGIKGGSPGSAKEVYFASGSGQKAIIETTYIKQEKIGQLITQEIGPAVQWKKLSLKSIQPIGSSIETKIIGVHSSLLNDTIISKIDTVFVLADSLSNKYQKMKLLFSLNANSFNQTPILQGWSFEASAPPELALSSSMITLNKQVIPEGESMLISGKVKNVGAVGSDTVYVSIYSNDLGISERLLKSISVGKINENDSSSFSLVYETKGFRGNHALRIIVDENNRIPEFYKNNNSITIPYTVEQDTTRPTISVTVDGIKPIPGEFVQKTPEINILFFDNLNSILTIQDTSLFEITLNNLSVTIDQTNKFEFIPTGNAGKAHLRWFPELQNDENSIKISTKNFSDNSKEFGNILDLSLFVSSNYKIQEIYNIPNPFSSSTQFTFTIIGPVNPDEIKIKIYTVAGRLIHEISALGIIGFNKIPWDGRDKDGDQIGNGVYLYKVIVKQGGKQVEGLSKLVKMR